MFLIPARCCSQAGIMTFYFSFNIQLWHKIMYFSLSFQSLRHWHQIALLLSFSNANFWSGFLHLLCKITTKKIYFTFFLLFRMVVFSQPLRQLGLTTPVKHEGLMLFWVKFVQALSGCFGKIPVHICSFRSISVDFYQHTEGIRLQLEAGSTAPWLCISQCYSKLTQDAIKYYFEGSGLHISPEILTANLLELLQ